MESEEPTLEQLLHHTIVHLASATGNLRLLAIGAPFAAELIQLAEDEVRAALDAVRDAEVIRGTIAGQLGTGIARHEVS
jgi:hypothetical protein